ncbi:MAG: hypothetical protein ACTSO3_01370 [Candidatus Heimdallarchaeaceae archaeon]
MERYLSFKKIPPKPKNKLSRYLVFNEYYGHQKIGIIHWKGAWRTYVWRALPKTDIDPKCFDEIIKYIDMLMEKWRESLKRKKK